MKILTTDKTELSQGQFVITCNGEIGLIKSTNYEKAKYTYYVLGIGDTIFFGEELESAPPRAIATEAQKQRLLNLLKKKGLRWNPKKMTLKNRFRLGSLFKKKNLLGELLKIR